MKIAQTRSLFKSICFKLTTRKINKKLIKFKWLSFKELKRTKNRLFIPYKNIGFLVLRKNYYSVLNFLLKLCY